jgi:hypothetical protein
MTKSLKQKLMSYLKSFFLWLFILPVIFLSQPKVKAQHSEVGVRVVLSGAIMFGPYYTYWIDEHNALNSSVLAAIEGKWKLIVPFALNAGYSAYFFDNNWRPEIGLQYTYLISPRKSKSFGDPNGMSILSLVPGVQFQWDNTYQSFQSRIWLAHFFEKSQTGKKNGIFPMALDFSYGYKFP